MFVENLITNIMQKKLFDSDLKWLRNIKTSVKNSSIQLL
jgi:hypothetical protein